MKKQAVNLVSWSVGMGGIEATLPHYVNHLSDNFDFTFFSLRPKPEENMLKGRNYRIIEGSNSTIKAYWKLFQFARTHRNDVFHLFNGGPIALELVKLAGVKKVIYHIHGTRYWKPDNKKDKLKNILLWKIALSGDLTKVHFIANSKYSKKRFYEQLRKEPPMDVIYNGFDFSDFGFEKKDLKDELKIIVVGRLVDYKNQLRLIQESKVLFKEIPNCKIYFIGNGNFKSTMVAEIKKMGLEDKFVFTGFLPSCKEIYQDASVVVSVSYNESFGNTLVEAILSGTPVIASDIPAHKEILEELPESIIRLDGNLAEQIIEKVRNIDFFKRKTKVLKRDFYQKFSVENHVNRFNQLYS